MTSLLFLDFCLFVWKILNRFPPKMFGNEVFPSEPLHSEGLRAPSIRQHSSVALWKREGLGEHPFDEQGTWHGSL